MISVDLMLDPAKLTAERDRITRVYLKAGTESVADTTKWLERQLEEVTREAVPGNLWRAWSSASYPTDGGPARYPAGEVFLNGGSRTTKAMEFWSSPGRIKSPNDFWLAIPTPQAGSRGRGRMLTPGDWEATHGQRLKFVYRAGKPGLLVAEGTTNARSGTYRPITRKRTAADERRGFVRGVQSVIIFVLVPYVDFANAFAIEPVVRRAEQRLPQEFVARVGRIG